MNERRFEKIKHVAHQRQGNLTVVLENVHDSHNIGAVLRTCDAVGIKEVFLLYTEPRHLKKKLTIGKRTSMGTRKWVDTLFYTDADACFKDVKQKYDLVLATHLDEYSKSLFEIDFNQSLALVFGNEAKGITPITMKHVDGSFNIPQMGMVESLNISVA
ncbi:MAG: RNA methyltransferase, partial [Saprospiraceae bacterium]|nr:RNA methyltransferase [Saprospiraceae bacterium]